MMRNDPRKPAMWCPPQADGVPAVPAQDRRGAASSLPPQDSPAPAAFAAGPHAHAATRGLALLTALSLLLLPLASCAVNQKKEVAQYRRLLDARIHAPRAYDPHALLTLNQALALANQNNEQISLRGEDYVQALIDKNRAVAAFLPTVSLQPSYALRPSPGLGTLRTSQTDRRTQVPLVGNINLFRGFGDTASLHAAEATIAQRRDLLLDLQATILLNVAQTYYQVLRSQRQVSVLQDSLALQQARVADIQQHFAHGLATRLEVSQTQAQADATAVSLIQARNDVANGRHLLAFLIGVPAVDGPLRDSFTVPLQVPAVAVLQRQALTHRQDYLAAQAAVAAARAQVDAAVAEYYPSVSFDAAAFLYPTWLASPSQWNAVLQANLPIFSAGVIQADVRTAWSRLRQAALTARQTRRQVQTDVQVAWRNLADNQKSLRQLANQVAAAREAYSQARSSYDNGLAINLDVLTAQDQLLTAQLQLASASFDRTVFYLDLVRATGRLVPTAQSPAPVAASQPAP